MFLNPENSWSIMIRKIVFSVWMICFLGVSVLGAQEKQLFETGVELLKQDRYEAAIAAFTELIDLDPLNPDAFKNRGVAHMKLAQYDQAIHDFEKTLEITPGVKGIYSNLGVAWYYKTDYKKAIENYDREIAVSPDSHYAYFNRAICWAELREYGKSLDDIDQTLTLAPDFYLAHCLKGDLFLEVNDIEAARIAYEKAVDIDPEQAYARTQLEKIGPSPMPAPAPDTATAPAPDISQEKTEADAAGTTAGTGEKSAAKTVEKETLSGDTQGAKTFKMPAPPAPAGPKQPDPVSVEKTLPGDKTAGETTAGETTAQERSAEEILAEEPPPVKETPSKETPSKETLGRYEIQAGAYQVQKNAQDQLNQLIRLGYEARILALTRPSKTTWYLVRTGSFTDRKQAEQAKARFIKDTGMEAYVRPRDRF
jgi:Tfp pilus assembly protein PilF/cell division protein FtsN